MNEQNPPAPEITIEQFRQRFPGLFSDPAVDDIYCNPGWRDILLSLCDTLQAHLKRYPDVTPVTVAQIKSKLGELHFFYDGGDAYCQGAVDVAARLSLRTCEQCGALGEQTRGSWISTLCPEHDGSKHRELTEE